MPKIRSEKKSRQHNAAQKQGWYRSASEYDASILEAVWSPVNSGEAGPTSIIAQYFLFSGDYRRNNWQLNLSFQIRYVKCISILPRCLGVVVVVVICYALLLPGRGLTLVWASSFVWDPCLKRETCMAQIAQRRDESRMRDDRRRQKSNAFSTKMHLYSHQN